MAIRPSKPASRKMLSGGRAALARVKFFASTCLDDGATALDDVGHRPSFELLKLAPNESFVTVKNGGDLQFAVNSYPDSGSNRRIHAGGVAAAGEDRDVLEMLAVKLGHGPCIRGFRLVSQENASLLHALTTPKFFHVFSFELQIAASALGVIHAQFKAIENVECFLWRLK